MKFVGERPYDMVYAAFCELESLNVKVAEVHLSQSALDDMVNMSEHGSIGAHLWGARRKNVSRGDCFVKVVGKDSGTGEDISFSYVFEKEKES
jgi:hypothetical protein